MSARSTQHPTTKAPGKENSWVNGVVREWAQHPDLDVFIVVLDLNGLGRWNNRWGLAAGNAVTHGAKEGAARLTRSLNRLLAGKTRSSLVGGATEAAATMRPGSIFRVRRMYGDEFYATLFTSGVIDAYSLITPLRDAMFEGVLRQFEREIARHPENFVDLTTAKNVQLPDGTWREYLTPLVRRIFDVHLGVARAERNSAAPLNSDEAQRNVRIARATADKAMTSSKHLAKAIVRIDDWNRELRRLRPGPDFVASLAHLGEMFKSGTIKDLPNLNRVTNALIERNAYLFIVGLDAIANAQPWLLKTMPVLLERDRPDFNMVVDAGMMSVYRQQLGWRDPEQVMPSFVAPQNRNILKRLARATHSVGSFYGRYGTSGYRATECATLSGSEFFGVLECVFSTANDSAEQARTAAARLMSPETFIPYAGEAAINR